MNRIQKLVKEAHLRNSDGAFSVSSMIGNNEYYYMEGDLTKNYVKLAQDVLGGVYGNPKVQTITEYGDSIKTDKKDFKLSYQNKTSCIKEVYDGVYIHTSMSSKQMKSKIKKIVSSMGLHVSFNEVEKEEYSWEIKK